MSATADSISVAQSFADVDPLNFLYIEHLKDLQCQKSNTAYSENTALTIESFKSIDLALMLRDSSVSYQEIWPVLAGGARIQMRAEHHPQARRVVSV